VEEEEVHIADGERPGGGEEGGYRQACNRGEEEIGRNLSNHEGLRGHVRQ
jgi:hypothetical protein